MTFFLKNLRKTISPRMMISCVCVCMCVVILFHLLVFSWLHDVCDIRETFGSTIFCCEHFWKLLPSSFILFLNLSYFTSKEENWSHPLTGEKTI